MIPIANAERTCGGGTACCDDWLTGNILGHELAPGKPCHFRGEGGCTIYEQRPHAGGGGPCKLMPLDPEIADVASVPHVANATLSRSAGAPPSQPGGG